MPDFDIINLFDDADVISNKDLKGRIMLINFFASWCSPCKVEHPLFFEIKKKYPNILLIGIDYKDKQEEAINYLNTISTTQLSEPLCVRMLSKPLWTRPLVC